MRDAFDSFGSEALCAIAADLCLALGPDWSPHEATPGDDGRAARLLLAFHGATFAYCPGGAQRIGFDAQSWRPSEAERESWAWSAEEWGFEVSLEQHVTRSCRPVRSVTLPTLLCETRATTDHHADARGFRLPSCDEWEWICGGGTTTLFPWGDHAPCDRDPIDPPVMADIPERDPGFPLGWDGHRRPNRWGIQAAYDPYKPERVAEPGLLRSGDGGATICGGAGFFLSWLTLAPSWFDEEIVASLGGDGANAMDTLSRRVLPLA